MTAANPTFETDVAALADLLHETSERHEPYDSTHPGHNWWDWYAPYMQARERGDTMDEASAAADRYMVVLAEHRSDEKSRSVAALAELLYETSLRHGSFEAVAPPHNWWDWYAAYLHARRSSTAPDEAAAGADRYMAEVKHVVVAQ
jgi:hypothetical protein